MERREFLIGLGFGIASGSLVDHFVNERDEDLKFSEFRYLPGDQKIARLLKYIDRSGNSELERDALRLRYFIEDKTFYLGSEAFGGYYGTPFDVNFFGGFPDRNHSRWRIGLADATRIKSAAELSVYFDQAMNVLEFGSNFPKSRLGEFDEHRLEYEASAWESALKYVYIDIKDKIKSRALANLWQRYQAAKSGPNFLRDWYDAIKLIYQDLQPSK